MMTLANIYETIAMLPPRVLIHGQEGVGKTTLAAKFPKPVFLQTEDGTPAGLTVPTFGLPSSYADIREALAALCNEPHGFRTAVVDSLDQLESIIWTDVCETNNWRSIEAPGYGRCYVIADKWWRDFLAAFGLAASRARHDDRAAGAQRRGDGQ
jgi:hypothetical protein